MRALISRYGAGVLGEGVNYWYKEDSNSLLAICNITTCVLFINTFMLLVFFIVSVDIDFYLHRAQFSIFNYDNKLTLMVYIFSVDKQTK